MAAGRKTGGRQKGTPNKNTKAVKDMIAEALELAGGVKYLLSQALDNPNAFMTLVGKTIPLSGDLNVNHEWVELLTAARQRIDERETVQ